MDKSDDNGFINELFSYVLSHADAFVLFFLHSSAI